MKKHKQLNDSWLSKLVSVENEINEPVVFAIPLLLALIFGTFFTSVSDAKYDTLSFLIGSILAIGSGRAVMVHNKKVNNKKEQTESEE